MSIHGTCRRPWDAFQYAGRRNLAGDPVTRRDREADLLQMRTLPGLTYSQKPEQKLGAGLCASERFLELIVCE